MVLGFVDSLATRLAGKAMGGNALYGDLKPGDRFHFPKSETVCIKSIGGWYVYAHCPNWRRFRTGSGTAVVTVA